MKKHNAFWIFLLVLNLGCKQKKFDTPQLNLNKELAFLIPQSIAQLRSMMPTDGAAQIQENFVLQGQVIANDKSGNFYKQIIIDDGTAAIAILLDANSLYNDFPIGRKVYVRCKGLFTGYYYKLPQLGFSVNAQGAVQAIPFLLWDKYLLAAEQQQPIKPIAVMLPDVMVAKPELFNRLIQIDGMQFADTINLKTYASAPEVSSATNLKLRDCDSNTIILRNSAYSDFRAAKPPFKNGKITAIYSVFNNSPQLLIRDTADLQFDQTRCP